MALEKLCHYYNKRAPSLKNRNTIGQADELHEDHHPEPFTPSLQDTEDFLYTLIFFVLSILLN